MRNFEEKRKINNRDIERIRKAISKVFDDKENNSERMKTIISKIKPFLEHNLVNKKKIRGSLKECSSIKNKDDFVECVLFAVEPFFSLKNEDKEKIERKIFLKEGGFYPLNKVLSYGKHFYNKEKKEKIVHIHLAPARELRKEIGEVAFFGLIEDGFKKLSKVVEKDKNIKKIAAISWIVAQYPKLVEGLGFIIKGEINQEFRKRYFPYEPDDEKIVKAVMARKEFLNRYLK